MPNTFKEQVWEFLAASARSYSYNPLQNVYLWFGLLWGLPIPLVAALFQALFLETREFSVVVLTVLQTPLQWLFLIQPLLFGALFGILGSVRQQKDMEVSRLIAELKQLAVLDPLTGLSNRRHFSRIFEEELSRSHRSQQPLSLIFLDLDRFKAINDTHGHRLGDGVLRSTADHLQRHCRPYDCPARWGGEEFIILLPDSGEDKAHYFAERIRQNLASDLLAQFQIPITVSIGVAQFQPGDTLETFVDHADKALYHAKQTGRNRTVCWSSLSLAKEQ